MQVPYHTVTSLGRRIILIDELEGCVIREENKERFSAECTQMSSKVGGDAVCFLQLMDEQVIKEIETVHNDYWNNKERKNLENLLNEQIDAIVRVFSPMGRETSFCGDVGRCAAAYLSRKAKGPSFNFLTGIPSHSPHTKTSEKTWSKGIYRTEVDFPKEPPNSIFVSDQARNIAAKEDIPLYILPSMGVSMSPELSLNLTSFIVYCSDLHLITFCGKNQPNRYIETELVDALIEDFFEEAIEEKDLKARDTIFRRIGRYFNNPKDPYFPKRVNVSFVEVDRSTSAINIRTYDKEAEREVQSHGNAASASAIVANELKLVQTPEVDVFPKGSEATFSFQGGMIRARQGHLRVLFKERKIFLEGPAEYTSFGTLIIGE